MINLTTIHGLRRTNEAILRVGIQLFGKGQSLVVRAFGVTP